ncbi:hypothetical protein EV560_10264 [Bosea sp. BK604]|nr:hypothetical protein EV560_10264 [Bosea sp. BK604]
MSNEFEMQKKRTAERADLQSELAGGQPMTPLLADDHSSANPALETPVEGRQGFLGRPVLAVLIGGLILVGIAWIVVHYVAG